MSARRAAVPTRSIARALLIIYALIVIYASLSPFRDWERPESWLAYLVAPWPDYWTDFDLLANVLAYVPFGFLLTIYVSHGRSPASAWAFATLLGMALSFVMETAQSALPYHRYASNVDLGCNALGALIGGAIAAWLSRFTVLEATLTGLRSRWFLPGALIDVGLALTLLWLLSQLNPSIPFLGAGLIENQFTEPWTSDLKTPIHWLPTAAAIALNFCGVGLFLSTLVHTQVRGLAFALSLFVVAFFVKSAAATVLLKPVAMFDWLETGTTAGLAGGVLLLLAAIGWRLRTRIFLSAVFVLAGALMAKLTGRYSPLDQMLNLFNRQYGQLLNFAGLTHYLNELWPLLALVFLVIYFARLGARHAPIG